MPAAQLAPEHRVAPPRSSLLTRRAFLTGAGAVAAGVGVYAGTFGRHQLEVTNRTFALRNLPDAFVGMRIAQISDIHLDEYTERSYLREVVHGINALNPDMVLITGDFVSRGPGPTSVGLRAAGAAAEILSELQCPQRLAILGNHDVGVNAGLVVHELESHGIPVLVDRYTVLEHRGDRLTICGSDDAGTRTPDPSRAIPANPGSPVIYLVHEPDYLEIFRHHPRFPLVDLMLSGHTHGGQMRLPLIGPLVLPPMGKLYVEGHFRVEHLQLYVNRGIGTVGLPLRFHCPSEITHMTLVRA